MYLQDEMIKLKQDLAVLESLEKDQYQARKREEAITDQEMNYLMMRKEV